MLKKRHPWDETLVIAVMVVSALCVLLLLASYIGVTGKAYRPTEKGLVDILNQAEAKTGVARKTTCDLACGSSRCILAYGNGILVKCGDLIRGEYNCLCAALPEERVIAEVPVSAEVPAAACQFETCSVLGEKKCQGNVIKICRKFISFVPTPGNPCNGGIYWFDDIICPSGKVCQNNQCVTQCQLNPCASSENGNKICTSPSTSAICTIMLPNFNPPGCNGNYWLPSVCGNGERCVDGECIVFQLT